MAGPSTESLGVMKRSRRLDTAKALSNYLRAALAARGIKAYTLAKQAGIGQSSISRILNCESAPTIDALERIAGALNVTISEMFSGAPDPVSELEPARPLSPQEIADAKRVARLATAFAKCDAQAQRIVLDLAEMLATRKRASDHDT